MQRTKGASGERELCGILTDALGYKVARNLSQTRDSGTDVSLKPFNIEVKRRKNVALLYEAMEQAAATYAFCLHADGSSTDWSATPCVALRADGKDWLMVMRLPDWIKLAREEIA